MTSKLKKAIGAVKDQTSISLAKVSSNACSTLEVAVLKATSHDDVPVEDKYVYEVLQLVSSNKLHAAACARAIGKRIGRTRNWVVALKSLMLVLRIFQDGDPYFPREVLHAMKRGARILNLSSFRDDSNSSPWDFTSFVRTFALYLDERLECFLTGKLQRRYRHESSCSFSSNLTYQRSKSRGALRPNDPIRDMKPAMLLDKMSSWQRLLERAIATRPTGAAKTNRLVQISLYAILQESFDLYKDISDGLALVLDSFFHLQYQNCVSAFQTCMKAVKQFEELNAFYSLCKTMGIGRSSEYPSVQTISEELIESLQEFLKDQSSFQSNAKPATMTQLLMPPPPSLSIRTRSNWHDSYGGQSDFSATTDGFSDMTSEFGGSQCTSLEDLISASESWTGPSISIDLEAYSASQWDEEFLRHDTGSSRSLPVSCSIADLMSLDDWTEQDFEKGEEDHQENQQEEKQKGLNFNNSPLSTNWELVLAETISSSALSKPLTDNNTNTFNALTDQPQPATTDLVLFEAAVAQQTSPNMQLVPNNHYNPFLEEAIELPEGSNQQSSISEPTFQATIPTFSAQNANPNSAPANHENDPFAAFCGGEMFSGGADQQDLAQQQQLWLQNQNKIIAKHL